MSQLDLFAHRKPTAVIYQFPQSAQISLAHRIAQRLLQLNMQDGKRFWQDMTKELRREQRRQGIATPQVQAFIAELTLEVHHCLQAINSRKQSISDPIVITMGRERIREVALRDGEAGAGMGAGSKILPGLGAEPHEGSECDVHRAREDAR